MTTPSIADLRYSFFGGGVDAEYNYLKAAYTAGVSASNVLAVANSNRGLYVPAGSLDRWARKRLDKSTIKNVVVLGDSIAQGIGSTDPWVDRLRRQLQADLGDAGYGFVPLFNPQWAAGGTWTSLATNDAGDKSLFQFVRSGDAVTDTYTWTKPTGVTVNSFSIYAVDSVFPANFSYSIDGGAQTNVSDTWTGDNSLDKLDIASAVATSLAIRSGNAAGGNVLSYPVGVEFKTSATQGVRVHNVGKASDYIGALNRTTSGDKFAMFDYIVPDLTVIGPFSNDLVLSTGLGSPIATSRETYKANYEATIQEVQAKGSDVLIVACYEQNRAQASTSDQAEYRRALYELSDQYGCALLDLSKPWGTSSAAQTAGLLNADGTHPDPAGHSDIAARIVRALRLAS